MGCNSSTESGVHTSRSRSPSTPQPHHHHHHRRHRMIPQKVMVCNAEDRESLACAFEADEASSSTNTTAGSSVICIVRDEQLSFAGSGIRRHSRRKRARHSDNTHIVVLRQPVSRLNTNTKSSTYTRPKTSNSTSKSTSNSNSTSNSKSKHHHHHHKQQQQHQEQYRQNRHQSQQRSRRHPQPPPKNDTSCSNSSSQRNNRTTASTERSTTIKRSTRPPSVSLIFENSSYDMQQQNAPTTRSCQKVNRSISHR